MITAVEPVTGAKTHPHAARKYDYSHNPMIVYWEMTQACPLACKHCRAEAMTEAHPCELNHEESLGLLRQIAEFGDPAPHLILTGGDPLKRADLFDIIDYGRSLGISVSITPAASADLTLEKMQELKDHGIEALGLSLDGSTAERHEAIRGVEGCYDTTIAALRHAETVGFPVQVNTLVSEETAEDLPAIYELLSRHKVMRWSLFFLIAVGRGRSLQPVTPERGEDLMRWIYQLSQKAPFAIKTTEAPSYRRIALDEMRAAGMHAEEIHRTPVYRGFGIRDGHGVVFVSNQGDIYPAGFLPLSAGNIRRNRLSYVYRNAPVFRALHAPDRFRGKCGQCEYRGLCGGSRARAFAHTGDPLASDPFCAYVPEDSPGMAMQA